jgi:hypothetical protein
MAAFTTTYQTYQAIGQREDLTDAIYDISPTDTPFVNNGGRGSASATTHEWQTDALAAVDTGNAHIEGDDIASIAAATPTVRVGNYLQISRKLVLVSGTLDAVDKAGRNTELAYQLAKSAAELKRDMEAIALENIGGDAGNATTARQMATMGAWLKTNISKEAGGTNPTWTSGVPQTARTAGSTRALSETLFKTVLQSVWDQGGTLKMAMAGPVNKQNISQFGGIATNTYFQSAAEATKIIGAADVYVSDFGVVSIVPNRFQRELDVWVLDPEFYGLNFLRAFRQFPLAKTGDADKRQMLVEWTLKVRNELAHGLVTDLNSTVQ